MCQWDIYIARLRRTGIKDKDLVFLAVLSDQAIRPTIFRKMKTGIQSSSRRCPTSRGSILNATQDVIYFQCMKMFDGTKLGDNWLHFQSRLDCFYPYMADVFRKFGRLDALCGTAIKTKAPSPMQENGCFDRANLAMVDARAFVPYVVNHFDESAVIKFIVAVAVYTIYRRADLEIGPITFIKFFQVIDRQQIFNPASAVVFESFIVGLSAARIYVLEKPIKETCAQTQLGRSFGE